MRHSVRSRRPWRMISCPAAKLMRWVNPSIATESPSRTRAETASRIDATFDSGIEALGLRGPPVLRPLEHAEFVALGILHDDPVAVVVTLHAGSLQREP